MLSLRTAKNIFSSYLFMNLIMSGILNAKEVNLKLVNDLQGSYSLKEGKFGNCKGPLVIKKAPAFVDVIPAEFQSSELKKMPCQNGLELTIDQKTVAYLCNWNKEKRIPHLYKKNDWVFETSMNNLEKDKPANIYLWTAVEGYRKALLEPVWGTITAKAAEIEIKLGAQNAPLEINYKTRETSQPYQRIETMSSCIYKR